MKIAKVFSTLIFSLILLFRPHHAGGDSIVAIGVSGDALTVAADSSKHTKATKTQSKGTPNSRPPCKITALSPNLFFARSGRTGVGQWVTTDAARAAYKELTSARMTSFIPNELARAWGERTKRIYQQAWHLHGANLLKGLEENEITIGIFGGEWSGSLFLSVVVVKFDRTQSGPPVFYYVIKRIPIGRTESFYVYGHNPTIFGVEEFYANTTPRSRRQNNKFSQGLKRIHQENLNVLKLVAAAEAAIKWAADTSKADGPVDALVLEKGKPARWVLRKCQCPAD